MSITVALAAMTSAATVLVTGAPAIAADPAARTMLVSYGDLDLARTADQDLLSARIGRAARVVCGQSTPDVRSQQLTSDCRVQAVADAQSQMAVVMAARDGGTRSGGSIAIRAR